jgi:hypothetical protein
MGGHRTDSRKIKPTQKGSYDGYANTSEGGTFGKIHDHPEDNCAVRDKGTGRCALHWADAGVLSGGLCHRLRGYFLSAAYVAEKPSLPAIDLAFSKEAAPVHWLGMFYKDWVPNPDEEGTTVFLRGYDKRGPNNERKRIYMTATTPDLIDSKYRGKTRQRRIRGASERAVLRTMARRDRRNSSENLRDEVRGPGLVDPPTRGGQPLRRRRHG